MKPPERRRSAPCRYVMVTVQRQNFANNQWTAREKHILLKGLRAQANMKELRIEQLKQYLPRKSDQEVAAFIHQLKGRAAREAARKEYLRLLEEKRKREAKVPAPVEVWTNLAVEVTGKLEEAMTVAFSQMLTIAATEPVSLLHSIPSKPTKATEKKLLQEGGSRTEKDVTPSTQLSSETAGSQSHDAPVQASSGQSSNQSTETDSQRQNETKATEENVGAEKEASEFTVDFEKIYKYLSAIVRGVKLPELSGFESAVIFDLLMSLPEELPKLDCYSLQSLMQQSYSRLTTPQWRETSEKATLDQQPSPSSTPEREQENRAHSSVSHGESCSRDGASVDGETQTQSHAGEDGGQKSTEATHMPTGKPVTPTQRVSTAQPVPLDQTLQSSTQQPPGHKKLTWKDVNVCPLNPFMLPLKLLAQNAREEAV